MNKNYKKNTQTIKKKKTTNKTDTKNRQVPCGAQHDYICTRLKSLSLTINTVTWCWWCHDSGHQPVSRLITWGKLKQKVISDLSNKQKYQVRTIVTEGCREANLQVRDTYHPVLRCKSHLRMKFIIHQITSKTKHLAQCFATKVTLYWRGAGEKMKVNDPGRKLVIYTQGKNNLELLAANTRCRAIFWILLAWRKGDFVAANKRCRAEFRLIQAWRTEPPVALILSIHYEKEEELYIYSVWTTASLKEETAGSSHAWQTRP